MTIFLLNSKVHSTTFFIYHFLFLDILTFSLFDIETKKSYSALRKLNKIENRMKYFKI